MKKVILLVLIALFVLASGGTALAADAPPGSAVAQAAMYAHTWGTGSTSDWIHLAQSGAFVPPASYPPGGVIPPSPVFEPIPAP